MIIRRKENLLGISGKDTVRKENKDFEAEVANLGLSISKNIAKYHDEARLQANIKEAQTSLRQIQEEDKNINIQL